jgi:alkaline phosphatase
MNTRSLNSMVTDSSAASSAWGSGSRVVNGAVNVLPDGRLLTPLYTLFGEAGWKTALVTTAEITHATPAGFAVAIKSRGNSDGIAKRYLDRNIEVLLGGGRPFFDPKKRKDKRDLRAEFKLAGYASSRIWMNSTRRPRMPGCSGPLPTVTSPTPLISATMPSCAPRSRPSPR